MQEYTQKNSTTNIIFIFLKSGLQAFEKNRKMILRNDLGLSWQRWLLEKKLLYGLGDGKMWSARSGTGLYDNMAQYNLSEPQDIFDLDFFHENPKPFFTLAKELFCKSAKVILLEADLSIFIFLRLKTAYLEMFWNMWPLSMEILLA